MPPLNFLLIILNCAQYVYVTTGWYVLHIILAESLEKISVLWLTIPIDQMCENLLSFKKVYRLILIYFKWYK